MTTLNTFKPTTNWQEITGVSTIEGVYLLRNNSNYDSLYLYIGDITPTDNDIKNALILSPNFERVVDNTIPEKIWAKVINESNSNIIIINRG